MKELAATAKAFLLDNNEATTEELNGHLKSMALTLLTDKVGDYWSGLEVDHLGDAKADLKTLAQGSLSVHQQEHIVKALEVITAAQARVHSGDTKPLLSILSQLDSTTDNATAILKDEQGDSPTESTEERLYWDELSSIYRGEHSINLKPASQADINSAHKTLTRFTQGVDWKTHTRAQVVTIRDAMIAEGLALSTVNKLLAKLCACINWARLNGHISHDYTKGLKVKGVESSRRAFSEDELSKVVVTITNERELNKKLFGQLAVITGARCGELTQLTREDIVEVEGAGLCIDINDTGEKTLKTKASARIVPLIDGAQGFSLKEFREFVAEVPAGVPVFSMSRDVASKWFNEKVLPNALPDRTGDLVLHSLRHTLATLLKQAGVYESVAQDVLGHANQSITFGLYGKAKSVGLMREALEKTLTNR
ncbi:tyrosine-type recombinase/integrase [Pantoea sp. ACRSH]|uniref:tyrosine-type recombinase/integrase n=1 Tax=unclassified Pantoea TaxID=2630326 RepID=UPI001EF53766|nr:MULTISPECIES: tyrosine-type recombinase/integrase [unclassified Pantoea]MCG7367323.1 tyrosine-type recombinase/integrase [Pantoea sp. ACRSH]MCG7397616.1 tyrosine-type recombinase/integrase [Pantoea sp. ACRSC]